MTERDAEFGEMIITRVFDAPRELVFECMTTPEHLAHFWGPPGITTPLENITIDLRPGGVFETTMVDDATGDEYPNIGEFVEVVAPEKLVWREQGNAEGMTNTVTFADLGDGRTETVTRQTHVPTMYLSPEARGGMEASLDRFAEYLDSIR